MKAKARYFVLRALRGIRRSAGLTIVTVLTIALSLGILGACAIVFESLSGFASRVAQQVLVTVYLSRKATEKDARRIKSELEGLEGVVAVNYVSSESALDELRAALGEDAALLDGVARSALPGSLDVQLEERWRTGAAVRALADQAEGISGVQSVKYGEEDVEQAAALVGLGRMAGLTIGTVLWMATVVVVANTIRLAMYARRDEIEIMSLVGASAGFVRAPFLIEGMIQGVSGGLLAFIGLLSVRGVMAISLEQTLARALPSFKLIFDAWGLFAGLLAAGLALGTLGSLVAVGRFLGTVTK